MIFPVREAYRGELYGTESMAVTPTTPFKL